MIIVLKVRLEPNNNQNTKLFGSAGVARWAYNWTLAKQIENYKNGKVNQGELRSKRRCSGAGVAREGTLGCGKFIKDTELRKELTQLKKTAEYSWLNKYSNNITKQAVKDACEAYKKFFKGLSRFPRFKSRKKSKPAFYQDTEKIKFNDGKVRVEKVGWIKLSEKTRIT